MLGDYTFKSHSLTPASEKKNPTFFTEVLVRQTKIKIFDMKIIFLYSLHEKCRPLGHFRQILKLTGEFCHVTGQSVRREKGQFILLRAVAGQRSSPDLCFVTTSVKIYDP